MPACLPVWFFHSQIIHSSTGARFRPVSRWSCREQSPTDLVCLGRCPCKIAAMHPTTLASILKSTAYVLPSTANASKCSLFGRSVSLVMPLNSLADLLPISHSPRSPLLHLHCQLDRCLVSPSAMIASGNQACRFQKHCIRWVTYCDALMMVLSVCCRLQNRYHQSRSVPLLSWNISA